MTNNSLSEEEQFTIKHMLDAGKLEIVNYAELDEYSEGIFKEVIEKEFIRAKIERGEYEEVLEDLNVIARKKRFDEELWLMIGEVYFRRKDYDNAINKLVEIFQNSSKDEYKIIAKYNECVVYMEMRKYDLVLQSSIVLENFTSLNEEMATRLDKLIKICKAKLGKSFTSRSDSSFYIDVFNEMLEHYVQKEEVLKKAADIVTDIIEEILYEANQGVNHDVVHYSSINVLSKLIDEKFIGVSSNHQEAKFRLYNTAYLNDPTEGAIIYESFGNNISKKNIEVSQLLNGSFYTASFTQGSTNEMVCNDIGDLLVMWRTYGKDDLGNECAGVSVTFNKTYFEVFTKNSGLYCTPSKVPFDQKQVLYKVFYVDSDGKIENDKSGKVKGLVEELFEKVDDLLQLNSEVVNAIVEYILSSVKYLFKSKHFSYENECRLIQFYKNDSKSVNVDYSKSIPKLYVELPKPPKKYIPQIVLGPKVPKDDHWLLYLSKLRFSYNLDFKLTKSTIKFQ